jgi:N utilization substance protein B
MSEVRRQRPYLGKRARAAARRNALQALYQWEMNQQPVERVIEEFRAEREELRKADQEYFGELVAGVAGHRDHLARQLGPHLARPLEQLDPVERAVLLLAMYELSFRLEVPWRVVVNEAIELAKLFGAEQSHRFINGVLDAAARVVRTAEIGAA